MSRESMRETSQPSGEVGPRSLCARSFRGALALVALAFSLSGCYVYTPLATAPDAGTRVSFALTDAGRLALGTTIGSGARSLEGVVESATDSTYLLAMHSVTYISGQTSPWTGEHVLVARSYLTDARQRQFSRSRTAIVTIAGIGGVVAFISTRGLLGSGNEISRPPEGPPVGQ